MRLLSTKPYYTKSNPCQTMIDFFIFGQEMLFLALLLLSLNASVYRPDYAVFGGPIYAVSDTLPHISE